MSAPVDLQRRRFLRSSAGAAGGLVLAFHLPAGAAPAAAKAAPLVNAWIRIAPDDSVTLYSNISELGQGTGSALAQMIAEELEVEWDRIRIEQAPVEQVYFTTKDNYYTDGSRGVSSQFEKLRRVGAAARTMLVQAAAAQWRVPPETCRAQAGQVLHAGSARSLRYGQLADAASALTPPAPASLTLKARADWRLIGATPPRLDIPAKVDGSAVFGIDVALPGMLVAAIAHCPAFGGTLGALDDKPALAVRGVRKVVRMHDAVAVVGDSYWQARKGLAALKPQWTTPPGALSTAAMAARFKASALRGEGLVQFSTNETEAAALRKDFAADTAKGARQHATTYEFPFLAHATMEPMNATAVVWPERAELWLPTQAQLDTRIAAAAELKLKPEQVAINTTLCGGGFGRRDQVDFALEAVRIARAMPGVPVKLIWSREEDMQHGYYRPACAVGLSASLDANAMPCAVHFHSSGPVIGPERPYLPVERSKFDGESIFAAIMDFNPFQNVYGFGTMLFSVSDEDVGVPVGYWRSVGASQNEFALESFVDELAHAAGSDPLAYRRRLCLAPPEKLPIRPGMDLAVIKQRVMENRKQVQGVLEAVVKLSGWEKPRAPGRFFGLALGRPGGTYVAQVAEISVDGKKRVTIHAMSCVVDCGTAVNPQNIRAQIEGGMIYGLSAALFGAITVKDGKVEQSNFHDFPMLTMAQTPRFNIEIMETASRISGIGEAGTSLAGPAVANAIFAATGERITVLPMTRSGYTFG